jgi:hypothetical protein
MEHPDHRQRPVGRFGDDEVADRVEVVSQVPLGSVRAVEQRLAEVGQRHLAANLIAAHGATRPHRIKADRRPPRNRGAVA